MATTLESAKMEAKASWSLSDTGHPGEVRDAGEVVAERSLSHGTGDYQADFAWSASVVVDAGQDVDLDFEALSRTILEAAHGAGFSSIKVAAFRNTHATEAIDIGPNNAGGGSTEWVGPFSSDQGYLTVPAGESAMFANTKAGWTVDGTHKDFRLGNASAEDITVEIALIGVKA